MVAWDSVAPILSSDSRFVLFASAAPDLRTDGAVAASPGALRRPMNVFLRDRVVGSTVLVSVNLAGAGGNGDSYPAGLSSDGRYALIESEASDLVPGDTNRVADVFLRDLATGATLLVSVALNGGVGDGACRGAAMTPDGRFVAFTSSADNLVPADTNQVPDVFVRDLRSGVTVLASVLPTGVVPSLAASSEAPQITPDGRYVAFYYTPTNGPPGVEPAGQIYLRDQVTGTTTWASAGAAAAAADALGAQDAVPCNYRLSADGQSLAYEAASGKLGRGAILRYRLATGQTVVVGTNAFVPLARYEDMRSLDMTPDGRLIAFVAGTASAVGRPASILVWDGQTGITTLASGDLTNGVAPGTVCDSPVLSADGHFLAFLSQGAQMTTDLVSGDFNLYWRDLQAGATTLLGAGLNGVGAGVDPETVPRLSADGRWVAFDAPDGNLVPGDRNRSFDLFLCDTAVGTNELVSIRSPALSTLSSDGSSYLPVSGATIDGRQISCLSGDGRLVAFCSGADDLVANSPTGELNVFVRDLRNASTVLVSANTNGLAGDGESTSPAISADGRYAVFASIADDLVARDANRASDVFVRDLQTGITTLVSANFNGSASANGNSYAPTISSDGRYVLFLSEATDLVARGVASTNLPGNLFLRDLQIPLTYLLTFDGAGPSCVTPDGRSVAYWVSAPGGTNYLNVWDTPSASAQPLAPQGRITALGISPDGSQVAYATLTLPNTAIRLWNRTTSTGTLVSPSAAASRPGLRFSANGVFLAYAALSASSNSQVFLYDTAARTNLLVSRSFGSVNGANASSDMPEVSPDGRFVVYRSLATDLSPGANPNGVPSIYLYDRQMGANILVSASCFGSRSADNRSSDPVFSPDGQTLLFESWASDLTAQDMNYGCDLFALSLLTGETPPPVSLRLALGPIPTAGPTLAWPAAPGKSYRPQYKHRLEDPLWQDLDGAYFIGAQGFLNDPTAMGAQRFYRLIAN